MDKRVQLERNLKPSNVWALALGSIIGFGCFVLPGDWMTMAGPLGAAIGLALGGLLMMVIGNSYGFMVKTIPVAGGEFAYSYSTFGSISCLFLRLATGLRYFSIVPLNATAIPILGQFVLPEIFSQYYLYSRRLGCSFGRCCSSHCYNFVLRLYELSWGRCGSASSNWQWW